MTAGDPIPTVQWQKVNKKNMSTTSRMEILSSGSLLIRHVGDTDAGMYRCVATNKGGSATLDVLLDVQCKSSLIVKLINL